MTRSHRLVACLCLFVATACTAPTRFVIVRHAEKATGQGRDPDLSEAGRARAEALLAEVLSDGRAVGGVYHTPFRRTLQTVEPVAKRFELTPIEIPYDFGGEDAHADAIVKDALRWFEGQTVVYAGHTTTVPALLRRLGVEGPEEIPESKYDHYFVVVKGATVKLQSRSYGASTP